MESFGILAQKVEYIFSQLHFSTRLVMVEMLISEGNLKNESYH